MATSKSFLDAVKQRRTYYDLESKSTISDSRIAEICRETILHTPSPFNSQSTRLVLLLGSDHVKLWRDITKPALKALLPAEAWESTESKLSGFQKAYGTVLLFEDQTVVTSLQEEWALFADKFAPWSEQTNAMHTHVLWTALELEGLGASLQHYNPLIDQGIEEEWKTPKSWSLKGQLVFGKPVTGPGEKSFQPLEGRFLVHGGAV